MKLKFNSFLAGVATFLALAGSPVLASPYAASPCAAKTTASPCAAKANPCAAKANPCAAKQPVRKSNRKGFIETGA